MANYQAKGQPLKYPTPEKRRAMWAALCEHVSQGFSMKSFPECDDDTCWSYAEKFPEDCPRDQLREAQRKSLLFWEKIGMTGMLGKIDGFNATSWIFNMKNRAGWADKVDNTHRGVGDKPIEVDVKHSLSEVDENILARFLSERPNLINKANKEQKK